ncbi:hypothetical protein FIBSPDRAFT_1035386 [Athelia psychrophila]|uniref:Uncharacterized protein n=1 Tax=Athelia psychrophila TaxID=1759441 RepID=A0A166X155_9AGAM|nr:hypothetical protein FIBSPDRAFT_1035386 [Fibularhizoctonia sp. CBS 109695]
MEEEPANCHHCDNPLTKPEISAHISPISTSTSRQGLSSSHAAAVHDAVSATIADIAQIGQDIARYRLVAERIEHKQELLESLAKTHKALLAPILRLPSEVLSEIFLQCITIPGIDQSLWTNSTFPFENTPLRLASVCRPWRAVALAHSRLWSSISLTIHPKECKRHIALLELYFLRSRSTPLCINLQDCCRDNINDFKSQTLLYRNDMQCLMRVVVAKSECWERIRFQMLSKSMWRTLCPAMGFSLPMLASVELDLFEQEDPTDHEPIHVFQSAPRLRHLHIQGAESGSWRQSFTIPWHQIQELILADLDWELSQDILDILMVACNIVRCDLTLYAEPHERFAPPPIFSQNARAVHLPTLQSFALRAMNWINPTGFLSRLHMPAVEELSLELRDVRVHNWPEASLNREFMFIASSNRLRKFSLTWTGQRGGTAEEDAIQLIRVSPELRELHLLGDKYPFKSATILGILAELDSTRAPLFAPNIEILTFRFTNFDDLSPFVAAMELRSSPGSRSKLRTINLESDRELHEQLAPPAKWTVEKRLRDIGVHAQFSKY